jgi:hypothetical protein
VLPTGRPFTPTSTTRPDSGDDLINPVGVARSHAVRERRLGFTAFEVPTTFIVGMRF